MNERHEYQTETIKYIDENIDPELRNLDLRGFCVNWTPKGK